MNYQIKNSKFLYKVHSLKIKTRFCFYFTAFSKIYNVIGHQLENSRTFYSTRSRLQIPKSSYEDLGKYSCRVKNGNHFLFKNVNVRVNGKFVLAAVFYMADFA